MNEANVDRSARDSSDSPPSSPTAPEGLQDRLVFIVGNSRTGTTMMGRIVGRHPRVFTFARELHFFEQLWIPRDRDRTLMPREAENLAGRLISVRHDGYSRKPDPQRYSIEAKRLLATLPPRPLTPEKLFEDFLRYEARGAGKLIPCDQTPRNLFYLSEILDLYPGARIVNMIRDPRDVLLSQKRKWKRRQLGSSHQRSSHRARSYFNYHPVTISTLWRAAVRAGDQFAGHPAVHSLRFEDLVADPQASVSRVCDFLGISYDPSLLEVPQVGSSNVADRPEVKGVDPARAGSWRQGGLNTTEVTICQRITGSLMKAHGYALDDTRANPLRVGYYLLSLPFKLTLAFLLNLGRTRNMHEALRRRVG